jgi:AraC-like DNA-binding protein
MAANPATLTGVVINPNGARDFGARHVILNGRTDKRMHVSSFAGPFSIKSVVRGQAVWETARGRYVMRPGRNLILNAGTTYALSIEEGEPVETFCVFFKDGFIEQALRSITASERALLDSPEDRAESFALLESVHANDERPGSMLREMHRMVMRDGAAAMTLSGALQEAAVAIVSRSASLSRMSRELPATRVATRRELVRRLHVARDFMRSCSNRSLALTEIAREACLSPFHFHRSFRKLFGETPHQFVLRQRLDRAAARLRHTTAPVTDIAIIVGFESAAHLSRAFRQRFQVSPSAYRREFGR